MTRTNASVQSHKDVLNFCNVPPYVLQMSSDFLRYIWNSLRFSINAQKRLRLTYHHHRRDWRSSYRPGRPTEETTIATKPSCLDLRPLGSQFAFTKKNPVMRDETQSLCRSSRSSFAREGISPSVHHRVLGCEWGFHRDRGAYIDAGGVAMRPHEDM